MTLNCYRIKKEQDEVIRHNFTISGENVRLMKNLYFRPLVSTWTRRKIPANSIQVDRSIRAEGRAPKRADSRAGSCPCRLGPSLRPPRWTPPFADGGGGGERRTSSTDGEVAAVRPQPP